MKNYPQNIVDSANKALEKGTKMSFEAICEMLYKAEAKKNKGSEKKWNKRDAFNEASKHVSPSADFFENHAIDQMKKHL